MRLAYFTKQVALNGAPVLKSFLNGCQQLGIVTVENSMDCDAAVIWSMVWQGRMQGNQSVYEHYSQFKKPVFVLEVGMLHRNRTWKLAVNGTTGTAIWIDPYDHERHQRLNITLMPWNKNGSEIVIAAQRGDSGQWGNTDPTAWYQSVVAQLSQHTDRSVIFRPHPRFGYPNLALPRSQLPKKLPNTYDSFDFETGIRRAWAVINFNSGPGSQAIIHGVPAFVDSSSLAAPVANIDLAMIEQPVRPCRESWLNMIAHTEWTQDELASGVPQQKLLDRNIFHASSA